MPPEIEKTVFSFPDEQGDGKPAAAASPEIEIIDDVPPADRGRKPMSEAPKELTDDELSKYDDSVKNRLKHFSKGYHDERRNKETALRERQEALAVAQALVEENRQLKGSLSEGHTALIGQAKQNVAKELAEAERKYKAAADAFDSDAMLAAQKEMTNATIKADKLENFRPAPVQQEESVVQTRQVVKPQQLDDRLTSWKSDNSWFGQNKGMTAYALGLHDDLVGEGIPVGSDKYYERLDADLRNRFPETFEGTEAAAKPQRQSNVVAPATRSTAPRKIVLTQSQVNIAKKLGVPLELYARKVAEGQRN